MTGKIQADGGRSTPARTSAQQPTPRQAGSPRTLTRMEPSALRAREVNPPPVAMPDLAPVFLVSSFRTSSTWLWQKFRQAQGVVAYYEIFNEHLGHLTAASAASVNHTSWDTRHPASAPYFIEFLPLLKAEGGVRGYSHVMAFDGLMPREGALTQDERDYVGLLIGAGRAMGKVPLLSCTRMLGRAPELKAEFGGRTVLCIRNLFHQWASYGGQAVHGNPYFLQTVDWTLKASRHDPFLALVDDFTSGRTIAPDDPLLFQAFLLLHLHLYARAYEASDLVLDTSLLAADARARHEAEQVLGRWAGAPVDLSDVKESFDYVALGASARRDVSDALAQFAKIIRAGCGSRAGADFVEGLADAALQEWERHDFYTGRARAVHGTALDGMRTRAEASEQVRAALGAERDVQEQVIAQLHGEKNGFAADVETLTQVRVGLETALAETAAEAEAQAGRAVALAQSLAAMETRAAAAQSAAQAAQVLLETERAAWVEETAALRQAAAAATEDLARQAAEHARQRDALVLQLADARARRQGIIATALSGFRSRKG